MCHNFLDRRWLMAKCQEKIWGWPPATNHRLGPYKNPCAKCNPDSEYSHISFYKQTVQLLSTWAKQEWCCIFCASSQRPDQQECCYFVHFQSCNFICLQPSVFGIRDELRTSLLSFSSSHVFSGDPSSRDREMLTTTWNLDINFCRKTWKTSNFSWAPSKSRLSVWTLEHKRKHIMLFTMGTVTRRCTKTTAIINSSSSPGCSYVERICCTPTDITINYRWRNA